MVTVSIGVAPIAVDVMAEDLYREAALYEAKSTGRNQTRCAPGRGDGNRRPALRLVQS